MLKINHRADFGGGGQTNLSSPKALHVIQKLFQELINSRVGKAPACPQKKKELRHSDPTSRFFGKSLRMTVNPSALVPSKKIAFTLAEVLITLGIVGVVAAMTLPALIQKQQKMQLLTHAKVVYNILNNAIESAKVEYGTNIEQWELLPAGTNLDKSMFFFEKYLQPHLKVIEYCKTSQETPACRHSIGMMDYNGSDFASFVPQTNFGTTFVLSNSAIINIQVGNINGSSLDRIRILYDVNGIKKPNFMGKDVFIIELGGGQWGGDKNRFLPYGYSRNRECSYYKSGFQSDLTCTQNSGRGTCLAYLLCNGWSIPDDYPW